MSAHSAIAPNAPRIKNYADGKRNQLVLVIDDSPAVRDTLCKILAYLGYDVVSACNGEEGMEVFHARVPDIVVTDIIMPEKEGIETIKEMRKADPDVGIIAISAGGSGTGPCYLKMATGLGANRTLQKPFRITELADIVEELAIA